MKKSFFIIAAMVVSGLSLRAQTGLDTLYEKFPNYHYNWYDSVWDRPAIHDELLCTTGGFQLYIWIMDSSSQGNAEGFLRREIFPETAVAYVPDSTMNLVGVAFGDIDTTNPFYFSSHYNDNKVLPERLRNIALHHVNIYDKHMNLLQSVTVPYNNGSQPARYIPIGVSRNGAGNINVHYVLIKHVYLDYPMNMNDTFYISRVITYNDSVWPYNDICSRMALHYFLKPDSNYTIVRCMPWEYYRFRSPQSWEHRDTSQWRDDYTFGWQHALMYPIVENPGDSCPQVHGVEVLRSGATQAFLRWQGGTNHHRWQLAYGPAGTPPEDCTVLDYNRTMSDLITLDPDSHYVAYVRAFCRLARDEWGDWSDPVTIWLNDPTGIDGVALPEVTLTPNPTRGTVTVGSSAQLTRIEVYDPQGRLLRTVAADGTTATLDLAALPPAVYTLIIHTVSGTQTRKLTVTR